MSRLDPLMGYNFVVTLVDSSSLISFGLSFIQKAAVAGFSECSGLETTLEVEDYREGGNNGKVLKFPTRVTWSNLRLKHGLSESDVLWKWHYEYVRGKGKRRDGVIILQNDARDAVRAWRFKRGLPVKWSGPALNAGQSQIAFEEVEIGHEGLKEIPAGVAGSIFG
jgi:phage tail-like protein